MQYVCFPDIEWDEKTGYVKNCCDKHKLCKYGDCDKHPSVAWNSAGSIGGFGINVRHNFFGFIMFHDHEWHDQSMTNHLDNDEIFIKTQYLPKKSGVDVTSNTKRLRFVKMVKF